MEDYKVAGLSIQRAALLEHLEKATDTFSRLLLIGKLKAVDRELNAFHGSRPTPTQGED